MRSIAAVRASWAPSLALALSLAPIPAQASTSGTTSTFVFDDAHLLRDGEAHGGLLHASPNAAGKERPLLVFLHGVNEAGPLHRGLGGAGTFDLRALVDTLDEQNRIEPAIVAGPSQTKDAWSGSRMWSTLDVDAFVDAVEDALPDGLAIDRTRIVIAGHSGAGCNPNGGLARALHTKIEPLAILALDTCMDPAFGKLLGEATATAPVHVFFQTSIWPRDFDGFKSAFFAEVAKDSSRIGTAESLWSPGANPHDELALVALRKTLPQLFPPPPSPAETP